MKEYSRIMNKGVTYFIETDDEGKDKVKPSSIDPVLVDEANQALLLSLIESVTHGDQSVTVDEEWLDSLPDSDYQLLQKESEKVQDRSSKKDEEAKKA